MSTRANWSYPTAIRFGAGRITELGEAPRTERTAPAASLPPPPQNVLKLGGGGGLGPPPG